MKNRTKIHSKIRKTICGTLARPRLSVYRSLSHIYAQLIDDEKGITLASTSSLKQKGGLLVKAETVGREIAAKAKEKKIKNVVFDRAGFRYLGAIKKLAESARNNGLEI